MHSLAEGVQLPPGFVDDLLAGRVEVPEEFDVLIDRAKKTNKPREFMEHFFKLKASKMSPEAIATEMHKSFKLKKRGGRRNLTWSHQMYFPALAVDFPPALEDANDAEHKEPGEVHPVEDEGNVEGNFGGELFPTLPSTPSADNESPRPRDASLANPEIAADLMETYNRFMNKNPPATSATSTVQGVDLQMDYTSFVVDDLNRDELETKEVTSAPSAQEGSTVQNETTTNLQMDFTAMLVDELFNRERKELETTSDPSAHEGSAVQGETSNVAEPPADSDQDSSIQEGRQSNARSTEQDDYKGTEFIVRIVSRQAVKFENVKQKCRPYFGNELYKVFVDTVSSTKNLFELTFQFRTAIFSQEDIDIILIQEVFRKNSPSLFWKTTNPVPLL